MSDLDRLTAAIRAVIRSEFPFLAFLGRREYVVQATDGTTVDCSPVDASAGLPGLVGVPLWPGLLGEQVVPSVGSRCLVEFVGGDPTRPIVTGGDPDNRPASAKLLGGGQKAARKNDAVGYLIPGSGGASWSPTSVGGSIPMYITGGSTKLEEG